VFIIGGLPAHIGGRDYLSNLPTEIMLKIMEEYLGFSDLWAFINNSRGAAAIFEEHAETIVTNILHDRVSDVLMKILPVVIAARTG
jgi:hypothetical protein